MPLEENAQMRGSVRLILHDIDTGEDDIEEVKNLVVLMPRNIILRALLGQTEKIGDIYIKGIAVGTGTTSPVETDTRLHTEVARKALSSVEGPELSRLASADPVATFRAYFSATEANVVIKEVALFGGSSWNVATPNSGILFSRALVNKDKSSGNKTLTVEWTIKLEG